MGQIVTRKTLPGVIQAEALIEATDVSGTRTFALKVQDDSMEPLFSEGEMIFVNPDLEWKPGDYVIAKSPDEHQDVILLRQVKRIGSHCMLHPLNRKYDDLPLTKPGRGVGEGRAAEEESLRSGGNHDETKRFVATDARTPQQQETE